MAADIYEIGQMRSRYQGCLLGGAVGDALGYPVEFMEEDAIRSRYGPGAFKRWNRPAPPPLSPTTPR